MTTKEIMSKALMAICLTRDYVGEDLLPAIEGWDWYDAGVMLATQLDDDDVWAVQFRMRVNKYHNNKNQIPSDYDTKTSGQYFDHKKTVSSATVIT